MKIAKADSEHRRNRQSGLLAMESRIDNLSLDSLGTWITELGRGLKVDGPLLAEKVRLGFTPHGTSTRDLLVLASETAGSMATKHPDWSTLAARISLKELYARTPSSFSQFVADRKADLNPSFVAFVKANTRRIDTKIEPIRDLEFSYFGVRTLIRSYLLEGERPQYMWMRVALALHYPDLDSAFESYELMSQRYFTHATPTLFNASTKNEQLASCFLLSMKDGSIEGIFETLKECAVISRHAGGIGLHCSNVNAASVTRGTTTNGGIVPMLRVFNNASRFVEQGGNKRPGAISITLEPWHADIFAFLDLKKNHGKEEYRARDLFYALWIPDLFMLKVERDEDWYLFSPEEAPGLQDCYGTDFEALYHKYVETKKYRSVVPARKLWSAILDTQIETGNPSILYKDSSNAKSNQKNLGTIKSSNLCCEIIEYSAPDEIAVCNLASLGLPRYVDNDRFDLEKLHSVTKILTRNLNQAIDRNNYPLDLCQRSNMRHRPIAIGVQGLADTYFKLGYAFDSQEAQELNRHIFETIYHAALESSMELAKQKGKQYETYRGSPLSRGLHQADLWNEKLTDKLWNWTQLRYDIEKYGVLNSLVTAVMPTASTSQILGYSESIEPVTSNMYTRRTLSGEFQVVNSYLVAELERIGLWTDDVRQSIIANNGSVQHLTEAPIDLRQRFKTVWELSMKSIINQSRDRAPFIDQSQSMNLFLPQPTHRQLTSMHFHAWKQGLKTGVYYLRTMAAAAPIPVTVSHDAVERVRSGTASRATPLSSTASSASISDNESDLERPPRKMMRLGDGEETVLVREYDESVCEVCSS